MCVWVLRGCYGILRYCVEVMLCCWLRQRVRVNQLLSDFADGKGERETVSRQYSQGVRVGHSDYSAFLANKLWLWLVKGGAPRARIVNGVCVCVCVCYLSYDVLLVYRLQVLGTKAARCMRIPAGMIGRLYVGVRQFPVLPGHQSQITRARFCLGG